MSFSASFLQSLVSRDPSEIIIIHWFAAQKTFMIIINVEWKHIFVETLTFFFFGE